MLASTKADFSHEKTGCSIKRMALTSHIEGVCNLQISTGWLPRRDGGYMAVTE